MGARGMGRGDMVGWERGGRRGPVTSCCGITPFGRMTWGQPLGCDAAEVTRVKYGPCCPCPPVLLPAPASKALGLAPAPAALGLARKPRFFPIFWEQHEDKCRISCRSQKILQHLMGSGAGSSTANPRVLVEFLPVSLCRTRRKIKTTGRFPGPG